LKIPNSFVGHATLLLPFAVECVGLPAYILQKVNKLLCYINIQWSVHYAPVTLCSAHYAAVPIKNCSSVTKVDTKEETGKSTKNMLYCSIPKNISQDEVTLNSEKIRALAFAVIKNLLVSQSVSQSMSVLFKNSVAIF